MWITDFREAHGLTLEELGRAIRYLGGKKHPPMRVSDILLENLETKKNYRTVPALADLIAEACGATAQQRDELVLEQYRGTWTPTGKGAVAKAMAAAKAGRTVTKSATVSHENTGPVVKKTRAVAEARGVPKTSGPIRPVVTIDRDGNVLRRFGTVQAAAVYTGQGKEFVRNRCRGLMIGDEYAGAGVTYRYADEWDAMTPEQRWEAARIAGMVDKELMGLKLQPVVAIDKSGQAWRYESIKAAARATGDSKPVICQRLNGASSKRTIYSRHGYAYRRAEEWDRMTEQERWEYLSMK